MNIFLSRPNWIAPPYEKGFKVFQSRLKDLYLVPRTIGVTDIAVKSPLDEVIKLMKECKGAVVLGFPQIEATSGNIKGEIISSTLLLPTEWNHIEAGLAYARSLPMLVIHHTGIKRGIFDRGALNSFIFEKDFSDETWAVGDDISGALKTWRDDVLGYSPTTGQIRNEAYNAIKDKKDIIWSVVGKGRKIRDSRPVTARYRERTECRIEELTDYYVRIHILSTGEYVTIPYKDVVISYDEKHYRPQLEVRS